MSERLIDTEENIRQYNSGIDACIDFLKNVTDLLRNEGLFFNSLSFALLIIKLEKLKIRITK